MSFTCQICGDKFGGALAMLQSLDEEDTDGLVRPIKRKHNGGQEALAAIALLFIRMRKVLWREKKKDKGFET